MRRGVEMCPHLRFSHDPVTVIGKSQYLTNSSRLLVRPIVSAIVVPDTVGSNLNGISMIILHFNTVDGSSSKNN